MNRQVNERVSGGHTVAQAPGRALALWLLVVSLATAADARAWETIVREENLLVQNRPYPGSALQEIRGETRVDAPMGAVMALLRDADYNHNWVYRSGGATILEANGDTQAYVYGIVDAPWPMTDRDTVVRFDYGQDPATGIITIAITNFPDFAPRKENLTRVPLFGGFWRLQPEKDGGVHVIYQVYGDPGGWIPEWVANRAAALSVTNTLRNMPAAADRYRIPH